MKKPILIVTALVACLVLGSISMAAAKGGGKIEVSSKISLTYVDPTTDPYGQSAPGFSGKVRAKKGCAEKRRVKIKGVGKTKTSKKGTYSIPKNSVPAGTYKAKLSEKTIEKGKGEDQQTIVCKASESKSITLP